MPTSPLITPNPRGTSTAAEGSPGDAGGASQNRLDDGFFTALWKLAHDTGVPAEFFLALLFMESSLNPAVPANPKYPDYHGLNQMNGAYLRAKGIDPAVYRTWPASQQMTTIVAPFLKQQLGLYGHPIPPTPDGLAVLDALNFVPGQLKKRGSAPDAVLAARGAPNPEGGWYTANAGLDYDKDGAITIRSIARRLASKWADPVLQDALRRAYAVAPAGYTPPYDLNLMPPRLEAVTTSSSKSPLGWVLAGLGLGAAAGVAWYATRKT